MNERGTREGKNESQEMMVGPLKDERTRDKGEELFVKRIICKWEGRMRGKEERAQKKFIICQKNKRVLGE